MSMRLPFSLFVMSLLVSCRGANDAAHIASDVTLYGEYTEDAAQWIPSDGGAPLGLMTTAIGRSGQMTSLNAADLFVSDSDAFYQYDAVDVWFQGRGKGIRHGFTVGQSPTGTGRLAVDIAVSGGRQAVAIDGGVVFRDREHADITYRNVRAWDAVGTPLQTDIRLQCEDTCTVRLLVDDAHAVYPIVIDPDGDAVTCPTGFDCFDGTGDGIDNACVAPSASVDPSATLLDQALIHPGAVVGANASVLEHGSLGAYSTLGAGSMIGRQGFVDQDATLGADVVVASRASLGMGGTVGDLSVFYSTVDIGDDYDITPGGFTIKSRTVVGERLTVLGFGASVGAGCTLGDDVTLGGGSEITGKSQLGNGVTLGANSILHDSISIGDGTQIGDNVLIRKGSVIGADVVIEDDVKIGRRTVIGDNVVIEEGVLIRNDVTIGDDVILRTGTTINRGVTLGGCADVDAAIAATLPAGATYAPSGADCTEDLPPIAVDDTVGFQNGAQAYIDFLANDSDPEGQLLSLVSFQATNSVSVQGDADGLYFTADATTPDTFTISYTISDPGGNQSTATITANRVSDDGAAPVLFVEPTVGHELVAGGTYTLTGTVTEEQDTLTVTCSTTDGASFTLSPVRDPGTDNWTINETVTLPANTNEFEFACVATDGLYDSDESGLYLANCAHPEGSVAFVNATEDNAWENPLNWIGGSVPDATDHAHLCRLSVLNGDTTVRALSVAPFEAVLSDWEFNSGGGPGGPPAPQLTVLEYLEASATSFRASQGVLLRTTEASTTAQGKWGEILVASGTLTPTGPTEIFELETLTGAAFLANQHDPVFSDVIVHGSQPNSGLVMHDPEDAVTAYNLSYTDGDSGMSSGALTDGALTFLTLSVSSGTGVANGFQPAGTELTMGTPWTAFGGALNFESSTESWLTDVTVDDLEVEILGAPVRVKGEYIVTGAMPTVGDLIVETQLPVTDGTIYTPNPWRKNEINGTVTVDGDVALTGDLTTYIRDVVVPETHSIDVGTHALNIIGNYSQTVAGPADGIQLHHPTAGLRVEGDANFYGGSSVNPGGAITDGELRIAKRLVEDSNGFGNALNPQGGRIVFEANAVETWNETEFSFVNPNSSILNDVFVEDDVTVEEVWPGNAVTVHGLLTLGDNATFTTDRLNLDVTLPQVPVGSSCLNPTYVHGDVVLSADWPAAGDTGIRGSELFFVPGSSLTPAGHTFFHHGDTYLQMEDADDGLQMLNAADRVIFDYYVNFVALISGVQVGRLQTGTVEVGSGMLFQGPAGGLPYQSTGTDFRMGKVAASGAPEIRANLGSLASVSDLRMGSTTLVGDLDLSCPNGLPVQGSITTEGAGLVLCTTSSY